MVADYSHNPADTARGILLGRLYLQDDFWSVEQLRPRIARLDSARAENVIGPVLNRDAGSAYRWTDLAEVFANAGEERRADYCYRQADKLAPHDPQILYAVADFFASEGNLPAAVERFATILRQTGAPPGDVITYNVFVAYSRLGIARNGLLGQAIPDAANARAYIRYLMESDDTPTAQQVWEWARERGFDDERLTVDYANYLIRKKDFDAAREAWTRHFAYRKDGYSTVTPVFNGGFEYEPTGGIPDWIIDPFGGIKAIRDPGTAFDGNFSLRIDFSGDDNPDFRQIHELVFAEPGTYRFEGRIRTAKITGEQGIRFSIVSGQDGRLLAETEALNGDHDWTPLQTTLTVPAGLHEVTVEVARHRSIRVDNQLTGTAWIDSVKLTRLR